MPQILELGYCPADEWAAGGADVEYAFNDYCIAQMATALGHPDDATRSPRGPELGQPVGRLGAADARNPTARSTPSTRTSGTCTTATTSRARRGSGRGSAHDEDGLRAKFGSDDAFVAKLDEFFTEADANFVFDVPSAGTTRATSPTCTRPTVHPRGPARPDPEVGALGARKETTKRLRRAVGQRRLRHPGGVVRVHRRRRVPKPCFPATT